MEVLTVCEEPTPWITVKSPLGWLMLLAMVRELGLALLSVMLETPEILFPAAGRVIVP